MEKDGDGGVRRQGQQNLKKEGKKKKRVPDSLGCFSTGRTAAMMVMHPFIRPEEPIPATARPTINMVDEVATPQIRDPSSKRKKKLRNEYLVRK
jgi:hypothetical protein